MRKTIAPVVASPFHPLRLLRSRPAKLGATAILGAGLLLLIPAPGGEAVQCGTPPSFPVARFPMVPEEGAVTCYAGCLKPLVPNPDGFVLVVLNLQRFPPQPPLPRLGENYCAPMYHDSATDRAAQNPPLPASGSAGWTALQLGQVFGVTLDDVTPPNIYVTPTTVYGDFPFAPTGLGPGGGGALYRILGSDGSICTFTTLPNASNGFEGTGLGNVCYDQNHRQLFVSDFDDGKIYRVAANAPCGGAPLDSYDHGQDGRPVVGLTPILDVPAARFTALGRRVWGLAAYQDRLYYAVWWEDVATSADRAKAAESNEIWSIAIGPDGRLLPLDVRREILLPPFSTDVSNPVSDISFSSTGRMLLAERTMAGDTGLLHVDSDCFTFEAAHKARVLEYYRDSTTGTWTSTGSEFKVGQLNPTGGHANSAGGAAYSSDDDVWATGDTLLRKFSSPDGDVYGLQWISGLGNTVPTALTSSLFIDVNGIFTIADKTEIGDIQLLQGPRDCRPPAPPASPASPASPTSPASPASPISPTSMP